MDQYYNPIRFDMPTMNQQPSVKKETKKKNNDSDDIGFNLDYFLSDDAKIEGDAKVTEYEMEVKKKRNSRSRNLSKSELPANSSQTQSNTQIQSDTTIPYAESYVKTNSILESAIAQSDQLLGEIKQDIDTIRASKTLKGKYTYLTNLTASAASLINTRITAAREMNNSISKAHDLELKRTKDLKDIARDDKNDDARIMDMYNAFINNPMGMYDNKLNMPTISNMMLGGNDPTSGLREISMTTEHDSSLTPEQIRMRFENNPNIEEVVHYDVSSGRRWFEIIDTRNGQIIPNYPTSDPFLLEDCSIDVRAGVAKNRNLDKVWRLVTSGEVSEY